MPDDVDSMQNVALKGLERRLSTLEANHAQLRVQYVELMARLDVVIKVGRYALMGIGASLGIDLMPIALESD